MFMHMQQMCSLRLLEWRFELSSCTLSKSKDKRSLMLPVWAFTAGATR